VNWKQWIAGGILLSIFFGAGALICLVVILALAFPNTCLESIWRLKPTAQIQFQKLGTGGSIALMTCVGAACGAAAVGIARDTEWGRRLAIGILTVNLIGDALNALLAQDGTTLIGIPIAGLMIVFLVRIKRLDQ
jgi:hypothetical protein